MSLLAIMDVANVTSPSHKDFLTEAFASLGIDTWSDKLVSVCADGLL